MIEAPVLETERLVMRMPEERDFLAELDFWQSDRAEMMGGQKDRSEVWRSIVFTIGHWQVRGFGSFVVLDRGTEDYYGRVGPFYPEGWTEPELGWFVVEEAEGKGIAHEAAIAARHYAYDKLGWTTAISYIRPSNLRSRRLAERLGAQKDGEFEMGKYGTHDIYRHPSKEALS